MRTWYRIQAKADDTTEISIFDEIGYWGVTAKQFISDLRGIKSQSILLTINSPGGDVFAGIAIYNALRASGKTINVRVIGIAASAASLIAMAGDKIVMPENTFMMVHNPWTFAMGNADELRDVADILDKIGGSLAATYVARTGQSEDEIRKMLAEDTYLTAAEAVELGFADEMEPALKIAAAFDLDRLPENIRAVFNAAQAPADDPEPGDPASAPDPDPDSDPVAEIQAPESVVAGMRAAIEKAGLGEYAAVFALDPKLQTPEALATALYEANEIKELCALVKSPTIAARMIRARTPLDTARTELCALLAKEDEDAGHVDTTGRVSGKPTAKAPTTALKTADVYAARR